MDGKKLRVLIVDDSAMIRKIIFRILKEMEVDTIIEAVDGQDALDKLKTSGPLDLILSDWNMPRMSGLELVKMVKKTSLFPEFVNTPIIMVTTEAEKGNILEALKSGATNYMVKPFPPEALKQKITDTLAVKAGA